MQTYYNDSKVIKAIKYVAMYLRKSRGELEEDLEKHRIIMEEICEKNEWTFVTYSEIGSGDSIADRAEMQRLLKDIEEGLYDAVIVNDYDRLGRGSGTDADTIMRTFKHSDTLIITCNPYEILNPNDERDEEMLDFKGFIARREYKMITKRLTQGRKIGLKMGRWSNGQSPYGYEYNPELKKLVPHKQHAEIYKKLIVDEFINGKSTYDIAWQLNQKKIPSPRNGLWTANTVSRLLKSEVHLGKIIYNKTEGVRQSQTKSINKKPFRIKPKEEWLTVNNAHKALKTQEEHLRILHIIEGRKRHNNGGNINALSGIVKCFNCNSTLTIQKTENGETLKKCEECGKTKGGDLDLVKNAINETVLSLKKRLIKINMQHINDTEKKIIIEKINSLEKEYEKHEQAIERIEEAYEHGIYSVEKVKKKTKERQEKILQIEDEILKEKNKLESFSIVSNEERLKQIEKFLQDIKSTDDGRKLNSIYKSIIDHVRWKRIEWYKVEIDVNFL